MEEILFQNRHNICRTCSKIEFSRKNLISIFDSDKISFGKEISFAEMINSFIKLPISKQDELPKRICILCVQQVRSLFIFKHQVEKSYETLSKALMKHTQFDINVNNLKLESIHDTSLIQTESKIQNPNITLNREIEDDLLNEISPEDNDRISSQPTIRSYFEDNNPLEEITNEPLHFETRNRNSPESGINEEQETQKESPNSTNEQQTKKEEKIVRERSPSKKLSYSKICPFCSKNIPQNIFNYHIKDKHPGKNIDVKLNSKPVIILERLVKFNQCFVCCKTFCDLAAYLRHDFNCKHDCDECGINFKYMDKYKEHFLKSHKIDLSELQSSNSVISKNNSVGQGTAASEPMFYSKDEFRQKFIKKGKEADNLYCIPCKSTLNKQSVKVHILSIHGEIKPLKCPFCSMRFAISAKRSAHISSKHSDNQYKCSKCYSQSLTYNELVDHSKTVHKTKPNVKKSSQEQSDIPINSIRFYETSTLRDNAIKSLPNNISKPIFESPPSKSKPNKMDVDISLPVIPGFIRDFGSEAEEDLSYEEFKEKYFLQKNNDKVFCKICEKTMLNKNGSTHAKSRHTLGFPFLCSLCQKGFSYNLQRQIHMQSEHPGELHCFDCKETYLKPSAFASHMKTIHLKKIQVIEDKDIDLNLSQLRFTSQPRPTQQNEEDFDTVSILSDTTIATKDKDVLTREEFLRTYCTNLGNFGYRCNVCDKKVKKGSIHAHLINVHAIQMPFKCAFCDKRYAESRSRTKHAEKHSDIYKCRNCEDTFTQHVLLVLHTQQAHPADRDNVEPKRETEYDDLIGNQILYATHPVRESEIKIEEAEDSNFIEMSNFLETQIHHDDEELVEENQEIEDEEEETGDHGPCFSFDEFKQKFVQQIDTKQLKCLPCDHKMAPSSLYLHAKIKHGKTLPYLCEICNKRFLRPEHRMKHMNEIHTNDYFCNNCDKQFYHSLDYKEHMIYNHGDMIDIPTKKQKDEIDIPLEKILFCENPVRIIAKRAGNQANRVGLKKKVTSKPQEYTFERFKNNFITPKGGQYQCNICSVRIFETHFKAHLLDNHATTKSKHCELCEEGFGTETQRKEHMVQTHPGKLKCTLCEIVFTRTSNFLSHMLSNHGVNLDMPIPEPKEDIPFANILYTDEHPDFKKVPSYEDYEDVSDDIEMTRAQFTAKFYRVHKYDNNKTRCLACGADMHSSNRRCHVDFHHATSRAFGCELCKARFAQKQNLRSHFTKIHSDHYNCAACEKQFIKAQQLIDHMLETHNEKLEIPIPSENPDIPTDEIRYVKHPASQKSSKDEDVDEEEEIEETHICNHCNNIFDSARKLRMHKRNQCEYDETGNQQLEEEDDDDDREKGEFACEVCGKIFEYADSLRRHKQWHRTKEEIKKDDPFECNICNERFENRDKFQSHHRNVHDKEFVCRLCSSTASNYIFLRKHVEKEHPKHIKWCYENYFKCKQCFCQFKHQKSLEDHVENKHNNPPIREKPELFCEVCLFNASDEKAMNLHLQRAHISYKAVYDKEMQRFKSGAREIYEEEQEDGIDKDTTQHTFVPPQVTTDNISFSYTRSRRFSVFDENFKSSSTPKRRASCSMKSPPSPPPPEEQKQVNERVTKVDEFFRPIKKERIENHSVDISSNNQEISKTSDPILNMMGKSSSNSEDYTTKEDTLYLKYMCYDENNHFKCLICNKIKTLRKYMLHHLKSHSEVPTHTCSICSEKFLFKEKYDKHLETHKEVEDQDDLICIDDHPKYQDTSLPVELPQCQICNLKFKLNMQLNNHNIKWHHTANNNKNRTMNEQKVLRELAKKISIKEESSEKKNTVQVTNL